MNIMDDIEREGTKSNGQKFTNVLALMSQFLDVPLLQHCPHACHEYAVSKTKSRRPSHTKDNQ